MKLATIKGGGRDGTLVVVDPVTGNAGLPLRGPRTLRAALEDWVRWEPVLLQADEELRAGRIRPLDVNGLRWEAPMPRTFQWCEGSTYLAHMERIRKSRGIDLPVDHGKEPTVYQAGGNKFLGPRDDVPLPDVAYDLDIEGTIAVITDDVPIGTTREEAAAHIKLVVLVNDLTYRALIPAEYEKRVGIFRSKPARSVAPYAVTPESLGSAWTGALLASDVVCTVKGVEIGRPNSAIDCHFDFLRLIEHVTLTRSLGAGSMIGAGTVSNRNSSTGYACLAELRAVETIDNGAPNTPYLMDGDEFTLDARVGGQTVFGEIRQRVIGV